MPLQLPQRRPKMLQLPQRLIFHRLALIGGRRGRFLLSHMAWRHPGARCRPGGRSRARSSPGAHRVCSRARSSPGAHRTRSRARSSPGAHRVRSRARSSPGAHRVHSRACSSPGAHRVRSRVRSRALCWPGGHP